MSHAFHDYNSETREETIKREERIRSQEEKERRDWRRDRAEHKVGCGHLIKRDMEGEAV
jgi:hypothetical protein